MKKILLTTAAVAVLSATSAFADTAQDTFYVKVGGNWAKLAKIKGLKSKNDATFNVGAGYYVMDNARFDLTFDHYFNPSHKGSHTVTIDAAPLVDGPAALAAADATQKVKDLRAAETAAGTANTAAIAGGVAATIATAAKALADAQLATTTEVSKYGPHPKLDVENYKVNAKLKGTVNSLMINGTMDLGTLDAFKFFVGAGVGVSQVKAKMTYTTTKDMILDDATRTVVKAGKTQSISSKQSTNLAFSGTVGAAYELAPGITAELAYSYKDMGKTKKIEGQSIHYKGHHVGAGVRFDI